MFWTNLLLLVRLRWEKFNIFLEGLVFDEFNNVKKQREHNEMKVIDAIAEEVEGKKTPKTIEGYTNRTTSPLVLRNATDSFMSMDNGTTWSKISAPVTNTEKETRSSFAHKTQDPRDLFRGTDKVKKLNTRDWINEWDNDFSVRGGYGNKEVLLFKTVEPENKVLNDEYFRMPRGEILRVITEEHPLGDNSSYEASYRIMDDHIFIKIHFDMPDVFNPNTGKYDIGEKRKGFSQRFSLDKLLILRGNDMDYIKKQIHYNIPYEVFDSIGTGIGCDLVIKTYAKVDHSPNPIAHLSMPILKKMHVDTVESLREEMFIVSDTEPINPKEGTIWIPEDIYSTQNR